MTKTKPPSPEMLAALDRATHKLVDKYETQLGAPKTSHEEQTGLERLLTLRSHLDAELEKSQARLARKPTRKK